MLAGFCVQHSIAGMEGAMLVDAVALRCVPAQLEPFHPALSASFQLRGRMRRLWLFVVVLEMGFRYLK